MSPVGRPVQQTVAEAGGVGVVLAGSPESIRRTLEDARRAGAETCYFLAASGMPVVLKVRDEEGWVGWRVREASW